MKTCVNHPDRKMEARGLCRNCYAKAFRRAELAELPRVYPIVSDLYRPRDGECYLCGDGRPLQWDHRHAPGREDGPVRGLLCKLCNAMLGRLERVGVREVIGYLQSSPIGVDYRQVRREAKRLAQRRRKLRRAAGE